MIAKAIKGRGFRGALAYDLDKEKGRVIDTNMSGTTVRELAKEFGEIRKLRPKLGRAVLHASLSAAPGEHLSDEQWKRIAERYLHGMGLENNQYLVTRHMDTEHEHVHLLVNRIRFDGSVTSDSHDYRRHEVLMREIERDFDLQRVRSSIDVERHAPTKGEIEEGLRTGIPSTRQRLQQLCDGAAERCVSFTEYAERLEAIGVELVPVIQLDGTKMSGLSYRLDGVMMKGSDLGRGYSPMGLAKRGVGYEKDRDYAAVGRCLERSVKGNPIFPSCGNRKFPTPFMLQPLPDERGQPLASPSGDTNYPGYSM
ncbi:relaxase/mobilization nuclease domain-containing protein [Duganella hordei]|uniref:relaxase/mobilization nuclease domain-containing protein n=1 Tax=Duganella hordei TaxID=2865934 RepID=UPI0030E83C3E